MIRSLVTLAAMEVYTYRVQGDEGPPWIWVVVFAVAGAVVAAGVLIVLFLVRRTAPGRGGRVGERGPAGINRESRR